MVIKIAVSRLTIEIIGHIMKTETSDDGGDPAGYPSPPAAGPGLCSGPFEPARASIDAPLPTCGINCIVDRRTKVRAERGE
jgi:hypothetical protein